MDREGSPSRPSHNSAPHAQPTRSFHVVEAADGLDAASMLAAGRVFDAVVARNRSIIGYLSRARLTGGLPRESRLKVALRDRLTS